MGKIIEIEVSQEWCSKSSLYGDRLWATLKSDEWL